MNFKSLHLVLVLIFTLVLSVQGQENTQRRERPRVSISGSVIEQKSKEGLSFANVMLLSVRDSSLIAGTTTDEKGHFSIQSVPAGRHIINISFIGYTTIQKEIDARPAPNSTTINLGKIEIKEDGVLLKEAIVTAQRAEVVVKGDTMEYNADAYKLKESAVVEDLLKKLPGVEVSDEGAITVQGKQVKKILVDGKDFFKGDPTMATKNIPAEIMDKLQIIDDKSELAKLTGVDDGEEETVINITIKKGAKKSWLGNIAVGGGAEFDKVDWKGEGLVYDVNSFVTRILDDSQIGIVANGNNLNNQRHSRQGGGTSRSSSQKGINSSISTGITFAQEVDKLKHGGDITYGFNDKNVNEKGIRQQIVDRGSGIYRNDSSYNWDSGHSIQFNYKMEYKPQEDWTIQFTPSISYTNSNARSFSKLLNTNRYNGLWETTDYTANIDSMAVNSSEAISTSHNNNLNIGGTLSVSKDFSEKKGRKLSLSVTSNYTISQTLGTNLSENIFYKTPNQNQKFDQQSRVDNSNINTRAYISYIEPFLKNNFLQFSYWVRYNTRDNIRNTYSKDSEGFYNQLDTMYSRSLVNSVLSQQLSVSYRRVEEKYRLLVGVEAMPQVTQSHQFIQNGTSDGRDSTIYYYPSYTVWNFAPALDFTYVFTKTMNIRMRYRGSSSSPTITQLDPTRDETNLTNIKFGNPDLLPTYTNNFSIRYSDFNREKQQGIMANISANYILNDIVTKTLYRQDGSGIRETTYANVSGAWNIRGSFMYNRPLGSMFQINNYTNLGARQTKGFSTVGQQTIEDTATTLSFTENLGATFRKDWAYLQLRADCSLSNTNYSASGREALLSLNYGALFSMQFTLPYNIELGSDFRYTGATGYSDGYNPNQYLLGAEVSWSFLKKKEATIRLKASDILHQQKTIQRNVTSEYIEDVSFNNLTTYVMVTFAYKFNTMKDRNKSNNSAPSHADFENMSDEERRAARERMRNMPQGGDRPPMGPPPSHMY